MSDKRMPLCTWAKTGTTDKGTVGAPRACLARGCNGRPFRDMPLCKHYLEEDVVEALYDAQKKALEPNVLSRIYVGKLRI